MMARSCSCRIEPSRCNGASFSSRSSLVVVSARKGWREAHPLQHIRESRQPHSQAALELAAPVSQQLARRRGGRFTVLERELAVHDDRAITTGALHSAPFPARQIVYDLTREL